MKAKFKKSIKSAFVLGSTSAIAKEICNQLAMNGCTKFKLLARNFEKNNILAKSLRERFNVDVDTIQIDLEDEKFIDNVDNFTGYDLYLFAPGYIGNSHEALFSYEEAKKITFSNYLGILPYISKIFSEINSNTFTRIWSSVAGDIGRPSNFYYGAAKSALTIFSQGLFLRFRKTSVIVRVIKAGYVLTPMTIGKVPKVLCLSPECFAKKIMRNINKKGVEYIPKWWKVIMIIVRFLPTKIISKL